METKKKIMVAVDEGEESMYALRWALDHLINSPSHRLIIVHCQGEIAMAGKVSMTPHVMDVVERRMKSVSERVLSSAKEMCTKHLQSLNSSETEVDIETETVRGDARYAICEAAEEAHVDLLVVGSRGYGAIRRAVIGSVSNYCAHHAKCPVLIVKRLTSLSS